MEIQMARQANTEKMSWYMKNKLKKQGLLPAETKEPEVLETEEEIRAKLTERFDALNLIAAQTVNGKNKALIVSGPAGVGKSHNVLLAAREFEKRGGKVGIVKGFVRPTGLYRMLLDHSAQNDLLIFDDADSAFNDPVSLNILKAACELSDNRRISWLSETNMLDDEGDRLPRSFEYSGNIVFITNLDMQALVERGHGLSPHFEALMSRSLYIDLGMKTKRDCIVRIKQVIESEALESHGINAESAKEILDFIEENDSKLRELSLRLVVKIGRLKQVNPSSWKSLARVTCCK
jgi:DNA polymerase III delta prime subunit